MENPHCKMMIAYHRNLASIMYIPGDSMSQNLVAADFRKEKGVEYISDSKMYAKAYQDEMQIGAGGKYELVKMELYIVRREKS